VRRPLAGLVGDGTDACSYTRRSRTGGRSSHQAVEAFLPGGQQMPKIVVHRGGPRISTRGLKFKADMTAALSAVASDGASYVAMGWQQPGREHVDVPTWRPSRRRSVRSRPNWPRWRSEPG